MTELAQLFVMVENNRFYSSSVILDFINNTMLVGQWFTSKQNNRPRTVVKVLFCSFKNDRAGSVKKRAGSVKSWNCYLKVMNKKNNSSSVNNRASSVIDRARILKVLTPANPTTFEREISFLRDVINECQFTCYPRFM